MRFIFMVGVALISLTATAELKPELRQADAIRIKEAISISQLFGNQLFRGYGKVPFAIILVTDSTEFLINHPNPSKDFKLLGEDSILKTNIYFRKTQFNPKWLATFPAVNGLSCIVVGTPENTGKNSTEWIITVIHEHFHQYQNSDPAYFKAVEELGLSNGDQTGMWMLNYPFPYDSLPIKKKYEAFTTALHNAVTSGMKNHKRNMQTYYKSRQELKNSLPPPDYRYFSFQVWQEGLARYNEYKILEMLSGYKPSNEVLNLPDFIPFNKLKLEMYNGEMKGLIKNRLNEVKRVCFYSIGFAEGILLSRSNSDWRKNYLTDKFYVEHYFKAK